MTPPTVAFFCMENAGHIQRCLAVIEAVAAGGMDVIAFTSAAYQPQVTAAGARFVDLFAGRPLADADDTTLPRSSRYVTFAGRFGDAVIADVRPYRPDLVITDSFAVIGRVVAHALGVPYVSVRSGHNVSQERGVAEMASLPGRTISDACHRAVAALRERLGLPDASAYSQIAPPSPHLNVCCEPPRFLTQAEREAIEPIAWFGSLTARWARAGGAADSPTAFPCAADRKVFVSFGTVACHYYSGEAVAAMRSIAAAVAGSSGTCALISLGNVDIDPGVIAELEGPSVRIERYVDQWEVLGEADVFVTHHGLNSTHEAIFRRVPMVSYPFWLDQPALAARCQAMDLAVPIAPGRRPPIVPDQVRTALERLTAERERFDVGLATACAWEKEVIAQRGAAVAQIRGLVE